MRPLPNAVLLASARGRAWAALLAGALASACTVADGPDTDEVGAAPLADTHTAVGVIAWDDECPPGTERVWIFEDNEDSLNTNLRQGTNRGIKTRNDDPSATTWTFCRVDGFRFRPYTADPASKQQFYAVLKLGPNCPAGSTEVGRYVDDEDDNNGNEGSLDLFPNSWQTGNLTLYFCVFRTHWFAGSPLPYKMSSFPDLGFSYGVFANRAASYALETGSLLTDDEDDGNGSKLLASEELLESVEGFFTLDTAKNSYYEFVRVR